MRESLSEVGARLKAAGVRYVFGAYVDVHGVPESKCVPIDHFEDMARGSELYTVGALEGMGELGPNEDECVAIPDIDALTVLPWDRRYALAPANLFLHGAPYDHDFRRLLQDQVAAAAELGFRINLGIEPELYVMRPDAGGGWTPWIDEDAVNLPTRGYDLETTMLADRFLEPMVDYINELGWDVYSFDHEGGDGQYEFDFGYTDALTMADRMIVFRLMAKHVARSLGCMATFMPKPSQTAFGSGAHLNISLADLDAGRNLFELVPPGSTTKQVAIEDGYDPIAYQFTAGVLAHADAVTAVLAPTVNSYKRLLPRGLMNEISWAPVFRAYGNNNRTLMLRLPSNRRCLEVRVADSAANIYLGTALTIAAGLDGIRRGLDAGEPVNFDTYKTSAADLEKAGVHRLPSTLGEAIEEFARSEFARETVGEALHASYVELKRAEWLTYNTVVSEWERAQYLQLW
ncbi:MAG: glutamine synthetase [Pseudonocardiales bacterium]|nr:glutamine synthetase [Pseudonocardiales bacterium]